MMGLGQYHSILKKYKYAPIRIEMRKIYAQTEAKMRKNCAFLFDQVRKACYTIDG